MYTNERIGCKRRVQESSHFSREDGVEQCALAHGTSSAASTVADVCIQQFKRKEGNRGLTLLRKDACKQATGLRGSRLRQHTQAGKAGPTGWKGSMHAANMALGNASGTMHAALLMEVMSIH